MQCWRNMNPRKVCLVAVIMKTCHKQQVSSLTLHVNSYQLLLELSRCLSDSGYGASSIAALCGGWGLLIQGSAVKMRCSYSAVHDHYSGAIELPIADILLLVYTSCHAGVSAAGANGSKRPLSGSTAVPLSAPACRCGAGRCDVETDINGRRFFVCPDEVGAVGGYPCRMNYQHSLVSTQLLGLYSPS